MREWGKKPKVCSDLGEKGPKQPGTLDANNKNQPTEAYGKGGGCSITRWNGSQQLFTAREELNWKLEIQQTCQKPSQRISFTHPQTLQKEAVFLFDHLPHN